MSAWLRRKRLVLSLSLLCASLLVLQRLAERDALGLRARAWSSCRPAAPERLEPSAPNGTAAPDRVWTGPDRVWTGPDLNCSEDSSVRAQDWFRRLDARFHQFVLRRHCRYFPVLLDHPEKCARGRVHLLIVVKSVIEQHDRREAVRQTWGREHETEAGSVRTVFLLGRAAAGKDARNLQRLLELEDRVHGDILQWDFQDTFFNLTLKEVNFLRWFHTHCARTSFIFKGDDDVFVNAHNLLELLRFRAEERREARLFVGDVISKAGPIRNRQSKYYIPKELHDRPYPPYAGGGGFLMSGAVARGLFAASQHVQLFPIDDVFLGMCLQRAGVTPEAHAGFRTFGVTRRRLSPMNREPCFYRDLLVVHKLSARELLRMWNVTHEEGLVCARATAV